MLNTNSNENLLKNIFSYLSVKDLCTMEIVSKANCKLASKFPHKWREECNSYFYSGNEHLDMINKKRLELIYQDELNSGVNEISWKDLYKRGYDNRNAFYRYENFEFPNILDEIRAIDDISYSALREHMSMPKLRREYLFLENDLNTSHQTYNYDILADQKDIYDHYESLFISEIGTKDVTIEIHSEDLPLENLMSCASDILLSMLKNENDTRIFLSLRWYENVETVGNNPVNFIIGNLYKKFNIFCVMSLNYIKKYFVDKCKFIDLYCNEYVKRYKTFCDSAIYLNEQLETLNVIVNYLYEKLFPERKSEIEKFSIYRMMILIWNQVVVSNLLTCDNGMDLFSVLDKLVQNFTEKELSCDNIEFDLRCSSNNAFIHSKATLDPRCSTSFFDLSNSLKSSISFSSSQSQSFVSSEAASQLKDLDCYELPSPYSRNNTKYFIEQIVSNILDIDCNEYSVFYLNHTNMKTTAIYDHAEEVISLAMSRVIIDTLQRKPQDKETILSFFNNFIGDRGLRFINRTKLYLMKSIIQPLIEITSQDLEFIFSEYIQKSSFSQKEFESFAYQTHHCEESNAVQKQVEIDMGNIERNLLIIAQAYINELMKEKSEDYAIFLVKSFIREMKKSNHKCIGAINDGLSAYYNECEKLDKSNRKVIKEHQKSGRMFEDCKEYSISMQNYNDEVEIDIAMN